MSGSTATRIIFNKEFDTSSITKLNGDNYRIWRLRLTSLLAVYNVLDIVNGTLPRPIAAGKDQDNWDRRNDESYALMISTMNDEQVELIYGCKTAADIWEKLSQIYQISSEEYKEILWRKFFGTLASEEKSPVKTMLEIQNYAAQLRTMGVEIEDNVEVARIISSLIGGKYRRFLEAWGFEDRANQTSALLLSRLKTWELENEESKKENKIFNASNEEDQNVYGGKPRKSREEIDIIKKKTKCHVCKAKGHWKNECPQNLKISKSIYRGVY